MTFPIRTYVEMQPVKDWLHRLYAHGAAHGGELVESWRVADNVSTTCRVLDALVDEGWIIPHEKSAPTLEMVFFGVGGRAPGTKSRGGRWRASHTYACEFRRWLHSDEISDETIRGWITEYPTEPPPGAHKETTS